MTAGSKPPLITVQLYTKPDCYLCDEARDLLEDLSDTYIFAIEGIDITADRGLFEKYRYVIPVVALAGAGEVTAPLDRTRVTQLLDRGGIPCRRRFRFPWQR